MTDDEEEVSLELGNLLFGHSRGEFQVPRGWETLFFALLEYADLNTYGVYEATWEGFKNDVWRTRPYWWGDDDATEGSLPNFEYKPTGFELRWYKYPLRDSYMNQPLNFSEFKKIIRHCIYSVDGDTDAPSQIPAGA